MPNLYRAAAVTALIALTVSGGRLSLAAPPDAEPKSELKPEVAALLKQSTAVYKSLKSYQHTVTWTQKGIGPSGSGLKEEARYVLALERPNKFCFKTEGDSPDTAAVSDGMTFINYRGGRVNQYMKMAAPASYKGINIVDDVMFNPFATYIVALMLQGDALADKDIKAAFLQATVRPQVTEDGKKWDVLRMPFGDHALQTDVYFDAQTHLLGKSVMRTTTPEGITLEITDTFENVKLDKPIEASVFKYAPPDNARQVQKFTDPEDFNPNNALLFLY
jgi:outer membrane lipoprotein-sorting protein